MAYFSLKNKASLSPRPTARVLSATPSRFWFLECPGRTTTPAQAIGKTMLRSNVFSDGKTLSGIELLRV